MYGVLDYTILSLFKENGVKMSKLKLYGVRLEEVVGKEYEQMASEMGLTTGEYLRIVLTNNLHTVSLKNEVNRIENIVLDFDKSMKKSMEKFTVDNQFNEKFYEDFGGIYMMMLGALMQLKIEKDDIRGMQSKGVSYAHNNFLGKEK